MSSPSQPTPFPALYLYPINDSFIPKRIALSKYKRVQIGRQTNATTAPSDKNGYFDSKVLSRQHAEVWEEAGKIFIKDAKSSNGTFINGERLSPEDGYQSEPFELKSDDLVEFGTDIIAIDNRTIIHHKVAARVVCVFNEQDVQVAARAEQHQRQYHPQGMATLPGAQPGVGVNDSAAAFNFAGAQQQRRTQLGQQGLTGMGGMGGHLFITDIEIEPQAIAVGGFGRVFKGKYGGQLVALKMLYQSRRPGDSVEKDLYREAYAWRSLSHRFILPLLGIYEEGPQLFLVSPFMTNGSLRDWRKDHIPVRIDEMRRLLLEVAEGIQYIHSEGIVHGDLHSANVLLDSEFHCQITDFGSSRHCDVTVTRSTTTVSFNFAAPELIGMCGTCGELDCDESHNDEDEQHKVKTMKTDVYAFGCLYYAIFFDTVPFHGKSDFQIIRLVTKGVRPARLENPIMEEHVWNLVQRCWKSTPSERPTMEEIMATLTPPSPLLFTIDVD